MEATELIKHFKYGTLEIMAKDLADQIEDHDGFFTGDQKPDAQDIIRHARTVIAFGQVIKIYVAKVVYLYANYMTDYSNAWLTNTIQR